MPTLRVELDADLFDWLVAFTPGNWPMTPEEKVAFLVGGYRDQSRDSPDPEPRDPNEPEIPF